MSQQVSTPAVRPTRAAALRFLVLIGVVSFFADMTNEGVRSVTGPYLAVLTWFLGSALMGILYDRSAPALVAFSLIAELVAIPFFVAVRGQAGAGV